MADYERQIGTGIHVTVRSEATSKALRDLAAQIKDRRQVNRQVAVQLSSWIARNFQVEGALNQVWASLLPSTANRKVTKSGITRGYDHILVNTGLLRASFARFEYDNDTATVGSDLKYALDHEEGRPERNLPRRPMLPTVKQAAEIAVDVYGLYIANARQVVGL